MKRAIFTKSILMILLALFAISACKKGSAPAGPPTSSSSAVPASNANQATIELIPLPENISCALRGVKFVYMEETAWQGMMGSVQGVTCWISDQGPERKKEIPIASQIVTAGLLSTKDYGDFQLTYIHPNRNTVTVAISGIDKNHLQSFMDFLQK